MKTITAGTVNFSNDQPFSLICGPCQIENLDHALMTAEKIKKIAEKLNIGVVYKIFL